jgi:hypothetical protein
MQKSVMKQGEQAESFENTAEDDEQVRRYTDSIEIQARLQ